MCIFLCNSGKVHYIGYIDVLQYDTTKGNVNLQCIFNDEAIIVSVVKSIFDCYREDPCWSNYKN